MKRTMLVLALAVLTSAGCRAIGPQGPNGDCGCGDACYDECSQCGPGPGCGDTCGNGRGGSLSQTGVCQGGGNCAFFGRYCGQDCGCADGCAPGCGDACGCGCNGCNGCGCCGDGYPAGSYDCSACGSPYWGNCGYRHPHGYVTGRECMCGGPGECRPPGPAIAPCGNGYCCSCCGQPAPGCCCCNSGDQHYNFNPGPPVAQTAYPYYTLRGPRDFLVDNPPSIGPY